MGIPGFFRPEWKRHTSRRRLLPDRACVLQMFALYRVPVVPENRGDARKTLMKTRKESSHNTGCGLGPTRILIVDDHPIFRQGIVQLLEHERDLTVCAEAETAPKALSEIAKHHPGLVIIDITLKGMNGIELMKTIKVQYPKLLTIVLSMHDEALYAERALRAGARGYVMKQEASEQVLTAVRKVLAGELYVSPAMGEQMIRKFVNGAESPASTVETLSDRELEVMELIGRGQGTRQIAEVLNLSVKTVESHRAHIKEKLNLKTSPEMMRFAVEWVNENRV